MTMHDTYLLLSKRDWTGTNAAIKANRNSKVRLTILSFTYPSNSSVRGHLQRLQNSAPNRFLVPLQFGT